MNCLHNLPAIPYDVLSDIFKIYLKDLLNEQVDRPPRPSVYDDGPLILSHVCRHWRDVALSTPILWSALTIDHNLARPIISHYLALAQEIPLRLYITQWSYHGRNPDREVLDLLLSRASKWRSVRILFDEDTALEFLRRLDHAVDVMQRSEESRFGALEEAVIEGGILVSVETSMMLLSTFLDRKRFPSLRRLDWSLDLSILTSSGIGINDISWEGLNYLKLTFPPPMAECLGVLQRCHDLETLDMDFRNWSGSLTTPYLRFAPLDHSMVAVPPSSFRELTVHVDKPYIGTMLRRYIDSHLASGSFVVNIYS